MFKRLLKTDDHLALFIVRITVALVILPHGAQKLLGLFGGYGFSGTMSSFTAMGIPAILAFLVIFTESIGALLILFGFATRLWALMLTTLMLVAINVHHANGFFMNWGGTNAGEGFEYHLLVIGICIALIIKGAGRWSADRQLTK